MPHIRLLLAYVGTDTLHLPGLLLLLNLYLNSGHPERSEGPLLRSNHPRRSKLLHPPLSPCKITPMSATFSLLLAVILSASAFAQTPLQQKIHRIATAAKGKVSVSCSLPQSSLTCDLAPHSRPPMQSVFKLPLALTVLHQVESKSLSLDQSIRFLPSDRFIPRTHSPLQDQYPEGNADIPLRELLRLAVSQSDNVAGDILVRVIGGPQVVDQYIASLGVRGFHMEDDEHSLHRDESAQYRNWLQPAGAVELLRRIADNPPLSAEHAQLLLQWMKDSPTGAHRITAGLPSGTVLAHKTGSSGTHNGLTPATNDIGLIFLPDGRRLALAVFVSDSKADEATRDAVIAHIARAVYDAAIKDLPPRR